MTEVNLEDLYQMFYEDPDFKGGLGGNPDDSKKEAAWEEAQSRFKQHKNNEKALKVGINQNKADEAKTDRKNRRKRKLLRNWKMQKQSGEIKKDFKFSLPKKKAGSKFTTPSPSKTPRHGQPGKTPTFRKQYEDLEEKYENKPVRRGDPESQRGNVGHSKARKIDTNKGRRGIKKANDYTDKLSRNFPNTDEYDVTNEDAVKQHEEKKDMDTSEMVINGVMKDLLSKGIINSKGLEKAGILELSKDMSIPAIAGLLGAGAMLAKVFKLEDDNNADDDVIEKQVVDYMGKNGDFFEGVASMCDFICRTKDGEEEGDGSRGNRIMEAASEFHKQCGGAAVTPGVYGE